MLKQGIRMLLTAMLVSVLLTSAGCGKNNTGNNAEGLSAKSYKNDGYLGMTNAHPQLPGHHVVTNYSRDNVTMTQAIQNLRGVAGSTVTFNGADAYVTIKRKAGMLAREVPTMEQQAATVLRFNYPRYTIHVTSIK
ncbi:hypothetical protein D7Z26_23010 [Cohnella endophytica]|uniref:Sporulation protein n=1 Tax=Cohnella endophytica TaxID=2419778 RepID=A0A494XHJ2_9BACL|nr:hypothetical protein [Cohnella endophytica]RKP48066.1 hypothetical protein D7Z26_23010 [Cohnella endophytica]